MRFLLILLVLGAIAYGVYAFVSSNSADEASNFVFDSKSLETKSAVDSKLAVLRAKDVWKLAVNQGQDLSNGPCLDNALISGWVLDIAHNPRQEVDDKPENQCPAYVNGTAKHFVELDPQGNFIRAE